MSCGESSLIRAAASSSASGRPSRRRQSSATALGVQLGELEVGPDVARASDKEPYRLRAPETVDLERARRVGKLERGDGVDPLFGDVERRAAGDEERQAGCTREQLGEHRRRVEQLLEVVEHEQRPPAAQGGDQRFERSAFRPLDQAERAGDRGRDEVGVADRSELDEHHATGELGVEACCGLDGEPRLSRSGRSRQGQEAHICPAQQRADLPLLPAPADERGRSRSQPRRPAGASGADRRDVQLRILIEDRPLEAAQRRPRLDPELLDQGGPRRPVGVQRLRLPARAVEREHELAAQALRQRVLGDQALELADELVGAAESEVRVDAILERGEVKLLEPTDLTLRPRLVGELGERRAAPEREGLAQALGSGRRLGPARLGDETLEAVQIEADPARRGARSRPGRVTITSSPSALRSWETYVCRTFAAVAGGRPAQRSSISRSLATGSPACRSRIARSARGFAAFSATTRPSATASSGPSTRKSMAHCNGAAPLLYRRYTSGAESGSYAASALSRDRSTRRRRADVAAGWTELSREHRVRVHGIASGLRRSARCLPDSDRGRRSGRRSEWDFRHTRCRAHRRLPSSELHPARSCECVWGAGAEKLSGRRREPAVGTVAAPAARRSTAAGKPAPAAAEQPTSVAVATASRTGSSSVPEDRVAPAARSAARSGPAAATGAI